MNLVKWLRKNNKKLMAVVVVIIMVGFIGSTWISQLGRGTVRFQKTIAYYDDNRKITSSDRALAWQEMETLKALNADILLRSQDLRTVLLGELLFSEQRTSQQSIRRIQQMIISNGCRISDKQINDLYKRTAPIDIYWLLLNKEASLAGIRVAKEEAGILLGRVIPQLFNGITYTQLIGSIVNNQRIPEDRILEAFAKLLSVLAYSNMISSNENITLSQLTHNASWEFETIDVEFVKFDSALFAESQPQPDEEKILEQFNRYKQFFPGQVSEQNPYGFGYKLADRVELEYIAIKPDDVSNIVTAPTQEEAEEYYRRYREQLTEQIPSDPNDPNSPLTERIKSYAEVASAISNQLLQDKINSKTERILQQAKSITDANLQNIDAGAADLSTEQLKERAGDYRAAAEQLSKKHKIKVYSGRTGLLSATDIRDDEYLGRLYLGGFGYRFGSLGLSKIAFAIEQLGSSELGLTGLQKPGLYENIGPLKDFFAQISALVRITEARKAAEPQSVNQTFSIDTIDFEQEPRSQDKRLYSVKEKVTEDLKKLAAMETAKNKAEQFVDLATKDGWDSALDKFNELYGPQPQEDEPGSDAFTLQDFTNLPRLSRPMLKTLAVQSQGNPTAQFLINERKKESVLREQLYSLVPPDSNTIEKLPLVLEVKPDVSYYCLKNISVKRLDRQQYEAIKSIQAYKINTLQSQSLAVVHFNPDNILKRMKFRWAIEDEEAADANDQDKSTGAL